MFYLSLSEIAFITDALLIGKNLIINNISIDTRSKNIKNSLFIAIKGKNIDAHLLCNNAILKGAICLLVDFIFPTVISQLVVNNTVIALGKIARWIRIKSNTKILALTGSTGKTSVKEITANILKNCSNTLYTYNNFNNEIGVPLTLLNLNYKKYDYAIIEIGSNKINDIYYLSKIVNPDIALINNIFISHLNGFKNIKNLILEKGKIFNFLSKSGIAIINADSNFLYIWNKYISNKKVLFFSLKKKIGINIFVSNIKINNKGCFFKLHTLLGNRNIFFKLLGLQNIFNALASVSFAISIGISLKDIVLGLESCLPIKGRLFPIYLNKYQLILDDTYNANPRSVFFSLFFLKRCKGFKIFVISDMCELSYMSILYHIKIGIYIRNIFINRVLSFGKYSYYISKYSLIGKHFFYKKNLIIYLKNILFIYKKITILIKGSRFFFMEEVLKFL